jgi:sugar porter (SP) family MFS transporter
MKGSSIEYIGRKGTLLFTSIPFVFGWLLMAYAGRMESAIALLMGRFITGFCCGLISLSAPVYIAETANPSKRGFLGSGFQLSVTLGILLTYLTGKYVSWAYLAVISCIYPIMLLISMTLMPETPYWLIKKARISEATEANLFLHGSNGAQNIEVDISVPSISSDGLQTGTNKLNLSEFMKPHIMKPILLSLSLMFFQQFSGVNAIIFYTTTIFESAGSQAISPNDATILVGFVQVVATFAACLLTDRAGRRLLLVISGIGCGLSLVSMSTFYFVSSSNETFKSTYEWIPIVALISFIIAFSLGMGPIPWLLMGELLPAHVKSIASGLSSSFNWMCAFLITFFFNYLIQGLSDSGTYLLFAIISFVSSVFVIFLLPETRGKSLQEIENLFRGESMS